MPLVIQVTEFLGLIEVLIILYGSIFEIKQKNAKTTAFVYLCLGVFFTVLADSLTWFPYNRSNEWMQYVATFLAFVLPYAVNALFLNYLYVTLKQNYDVPRTLFQIGMIYSGVVGALLLVLTIMGQLFTVVDGAYFPGPLYDVYLLSYLLLLVYVFIIACVHLSKLGIHDSAAALLFLLIPVGFIIMNYFNEEFAFSIASLPIAILVINTMLQAEREETLIQKEMATRVKAHRDELTGLPNRLAFNDRCASVSGFYRVGVLFCDLNSLKYTNDHYGHVAGDKLLNDFASIARDFFQEDDIFRISGDEFVIFMPRVSESEFKTHANKFISKINSCDYPIAAIGTSYGNQSELKQLIDNSEGNMYIEKNLFHEKYPEFTRFIG